MKFINGTSVESILKSFKSATALLNDLANKKFIEAEDKSLKAIVLQAESDEANTEGNRALAVAAKIKAITE